MVILTSNIRRRAIAVIVSSCVDFLSSASHFAMMPTARVLNFSDSIDFVWP